MLGDGGDACVGKECSDSYAPTLVATVDAGVRLETVEATAVPTLSRPALTATPTPTATPLSTPVATPSGPTPTSTITPSSPRPESYGGADAEDGDGLRLQREYVPAVFGTRPQPGRLA